MESPQDLPSHGDDDFVALDPAYINVLAYVSGFLFAKSLKHHKCSTCENKGNTSNYNLLINYKLYSEDSKLMRPPKEFIEFIQKITGIFEDNFETIQSNKNLMGSLQEKMASVVYTKCLNFPINFCIKLFIRMKIFHNLKIKNFMLKTRIGRDKLKKLNYDLRKESIE